MHSAENYDLLHFLQIASREREEGIEERERESRRGRDSDIYIERE